ncbi:MAG: phosphatase PAP2 family protein [Deltaproteobacteria bacterium]|nr:phosphatase PAP2 family protein [Deltaproteobacteria bacterium]
MDRGASLAGAVGHLGPDLIFLAVFGTVFAALAVTFGRAPTFSRSSIVLPLVILAILVVAAAVPRARRILSGDRGQRREFVRLSLGEIRNWFPLVLITFVYENFHDLTDLIHPRVVDGALRRADAALFGVEPVLALQAITTPWLTEGMTAAYALFFFYPALFLLILHVRGEAIRFREMALALSLCFYLGLLGCVLVPAIGPRYHMAAEFTVPLDGIWITGRAAAIWNNLESIKRDCFPSLHTAISTIALIYLWRYRRTWRGGRTMLSVCVPLVACLWCSTVYLRYHWVVDVLAGWALAVACARIAPFFIRWYYARRTGVVPEVSLDAARRPSTTEGG